MNRKRGFGIFVFVLITFIFSLGLSSASITSCWFTSPASCTSSGDIVVLKMSSSFNAHGELPTQTNYNTALCCTVDAGETTTCTGSNKIIGLSSPTNAHAEIPSNTNYPSANNICLGNLTCTGRATCLTGELPLLSISSSTNAHIGGPYDYSLKICCSGYEGGGTPTAECTDPDGSAGYSTRTTVTRTEGASTEYKTDTCYSSNVLEEYYCLANKSISYVHYDCSDEGKVCENGACVGGVPGEVTVYWADEEGHELDTSQTYDYFIGTAQSKVILSVLGLTPGTTATFEIYESDGIAVDDDIRVGADALTAPVSSGGAASVLWTITSEDRNASLEGVASDPPFEFYFKVNDAFESDQLSANVNEVALGCLSVASCADYTQAQCGVDPCNVGDSGVPDDIVCGIVLYDNESQCTSKTDCGCTWNVSSSVCETSWETVTECSPTCGNSILDPGEECDDGNRIPGDGCSFPSCKLDDPPPGDCPEGTTLCEDGTCSISCPLPECIIDGYCDASEGCTCDDCDDKVDSCEPDLLCSIDDGYCCSDEADGNCNPQCAFTDPDCGDGFAVCGNGFKETGEECDLGEVLNNQEGSGCYSNCTYEKIGPGEDCPEGTTLCSDGTCSLNCHATDEGFPECNDNGVWDEGEGCNCEESDGLEDSCEEGLVCSWNDLACCRIDPDGFCNNYCSSVDPDCGGNVPEGKIFLDKCIYTDNLQDDCSDDNQLEISRGATWVYDIENNFGPDDPDPASGDYVNWTDGNYHYDPIGINGKRGVENCQPYSDILFCPAQIKVPFFGTLQFALAIILLIIIYFIIKSRTEQKIKLSRKKKKNKKK